MHNSSFVLKVSDLLRNPGRIDSLSFEGLYSDAIPGLSSDGMNVVLRIQGVNNGSVNIILEDLNATIHAICDLSGEEYDRVVHITQKEASYDKSIGTFLDDKVYSDEFPFANEHETINIEDFLVQCVLLEVPIVHIKPGKEYLLDLFESVEDEE